MVRECSKINKIEVKAEVKRVKDQAKAEARQAKTQEQQAHWSFVPAGAV